MQSASPTPSSEAEPAETPAGPGRGFLALGSGEAAARVIAFGASVYLARSLGADAFGVIGFATAVLLYLMRLADGGVEWVGVRLIAEDTSRTRTLAPAVMTARFLAATALAVIVAAAALAWLPAPEGPVLALYCATLLPLGGNSRWILLGLGQARTVAIARALGEATMFALVVLLVRAGDDLLGVPAAQLAGDALCAVLLLVALRRQGITLPFRFDLTAVWPVVRSSASMLFAALFGLLIYNADLIILRIFRGSAAVGLYAAAYALISFTLSIGLAYRFTLLPAMARLSHADGGRRALYGTAAGQVFAVVAPAAVGGFLLAPSLIALVFGPEFAPSGRVLALLIWLIPISLLRDVPTVALMAESREHLVLVLTAAGAVLNVLLNLLLIPRYGMTGAAVATLATETFRLGLSLRLVRRIGFTGLPLRRFGGPALATLLMAAVVFPLRGTPLWLVIPVGALVYAAVLYRLGGLRLRPGALPVLNV